MKTPILLATLLAITGLISSEAAELRAGTAKTDITDAAAGPVHDPLYAKALVLRDEVTSAALLTIDAVAIGEIGRIPSTFLTAVREELAKDPGIPPSQVFVTASHCHGSVRADVAQLAVQTVREAWQRTVVVKAGAGAGREDRISENRRLRMKDGSEVDMRRAYALPPGEQVAGVGPIDPQIGVLRLDRLDGGPLAVVYNFACHPIMNPPPLGNSADYPGAASRVIEEGLGTGCTAFFIQGCAGDINPLRYKELNAPPDAEPLGNRLGLSVLRAVREIQPRANPELRLAGELIELPRAADFAHRIAAIEGRAAKLVQGLRPTNLDFRSFLPLLVAQKVFPDTPSHHAQSYLHDRAMGIDELGKLDAANRASVEGYLQNIFAMEELTRLNTNRALLQKHAAEAAAAGQAPLKAEVAGLRVGDFKLLTFPGELTVEVGLNLKRAANDPHAFVAGYTNGYLYYTPTVRQRNNTGYAQEDCDCLVAPEWQAIFEARALAVLRKLSAN